MSIDDDEPVDPPLDAAQSAIAAALAAMQPAEIDAALRRQIIAKPRKVAYVVANAMHEIGDRFPGLPDVFYARRVEAMVERGDIQAFGDPARMRYCEVWNL